MSDRTMTVVQLLPSLVTGGVERGTIEVSRALCEAGHRSIVISAGGAMVQALEAMGAEHVQWDIGKKSVFTLRYVLRLRRYLEKNRVDILHARSRLPAWVAYLAWKGMDKDSRPRFVTTVHGLYSVKKYSEVMTRGEVIIAVSETVRQYIRDNYSLNGTQRIELIYRGVDPEAFPYGYQPQQQWLNDWYDTYSALKGRIVLTLPGRLTRLKGHHAFIDLVHQLRCQGYDVHGLVVGGEDPRRKKYAQGLYDRVASLGMNDQITFVGLRDDIRDIYAVSDIVFSLSDKPESFGRTTLEALSMGVPVVGYDHGGVGEILSRLFPQGLVTKGDNQDLCAKVMSILEHRPVVDRNNEFVLDIMTDRTLAVYNELCAERQSG